MKDVDICYIISHGFAARLVMQTDLLGKLVEEGLSIAVISPDIDDAVLKNYCKSKGVKLFQYNPVIGKWNDSYIRKRRYLFEKIRENPALLEKHIFDIRYSKSKNPIKRLMPLYWMFLHIIILRFPSLKKHYERNEKKLLNSLQARKLLEKVSPKKLIATYPVNLAESQLLFEANKNRNIETWIHLLSWDNISSKGKFPALADKYIAWGPIMIKELQDYYMINKNKIFGCGVPHFDLHHQVKNFINKNSYLKKIGLEPDVITIFFGMSSPRFAPYEIDIIEDLVKYVEGNEFEKNIQLIVRPHPQNVKGHMADLSWLPRLKKVNDCSKVYVDFPDLNESGLSWSMKSEDMNNLSSLIAISSIVINSGSTISIDALYHDKPVVITAFDGSNKLNYWKSARRLLDYTHLKKIILFGGIDIAFSNKELITAINKYIDEPNYKLIQRQNTLSNELSDINGMATEKTIKALT